MLRFARFMMMAVFSMFIGTAHAIEATPTTPTPEFTVTTTPDTSEFGFFISAAGTFTIDWGDGDVQTIDKTDTANTWYSHAYDTTGAYTIGISGDATAYNTSTSIAAIRFYKYYVGHQVKVASISGSLGKIFPTLSDGTSPRFYDTFRECISLTSIPGDLFAGITSGAERMFRETFAGCSSLTSIPGDLFAGITSGADQMFRYTFSRCTSLTSVPGDLFAGITSGAESMFAGTFYGCTSLTSIGDGLFSGITSGAYGMFQYTFYGCTSLTSIPGDLFAGITSGAANMFSHTFYGCTSLTGIPGDLFAGITSGAVGMFSSTFSYCSSLTGYVNGNMFTAPEVDNYKMWDCEDCDESCPAYYNTFSGANNMDTVCPENTYAVPKPGPYFGDVAVCLPCPAGMTSPANSQSIDACVAERCDAVVTVGDGLSIPMYKAPMADQSIIIPCSGEDCYISVYPDATIPNKYYIHAER